MDTRIIARVNNVDIVSTSDGIMVAIRPICTALGIDWSSQMKKIKADNVFSQNIRLMKSTSKDGKRYKMICAPVKLIMSWILSINPKNVKKQSKSKVMRHRDECYNVLSVFYECNRPKIDREQQIETEIKEVQKQLRALEKQRLELDRKESEARAKLAEIRANRS